MQPSKPSASKGATRAWGLAAVVLTAGILAAGWNASAQEPTPVLGVLSGDLTDPKPGDLSVANDLVALSYPTTSPRANVHGGNGLFSKSSSPTAYDVCLAQVYGGTLGANQPYTQTGRIALRAGSADPGSETLPVGQVPCSGKTLTEVTGVIEPETSGKATGLSTGFFVGMQGQLGRATGTAYTPIPGSVQWFLVPCSVASTTFAPSLIAPGRAARVQSCGTPSLPINVSPYVRDLAMPDVGTTATLPRLDDLLPAAVAGNRWIVSCVRLSALVPNGNGGYTQVSNIVAHDWFMALDETDPTWPTAAALALDGTRLYDRSGGNGCPVPLPPFNPPPNPSLPCVASWTELTGVEVASTSFTTDDPEAAVPRFFGAANLDLGVGAGRTVTATRVSAPPEWITSRTTVSQLNADSWQFTPHTPGVHRVDIHFETACRAPFTGLPEVIDLIVEILVPGHECELWKTEDTSANIQFVVGLTTLPPGVAVGSSFHFGTVTNVHDTPAAKFLVVEVVLPLYPPFSYEVTALPELKYCFQRVPFVEPQAVPNDPLYAPAAPTLGQWGMDAVTIEDLWDYGFGTTAKTLCVVDTDYNPDYDDTDTTRFINGYNPFTGTTSTAAADLYMGFWHGTATTSVAVGDTDDAFGIAGAAEADYWFGVVGDPMDPVAMYFAAYWCAVTEDVDVISMPLGIDLATINPGDEDDVADFVEDMLNDIATSDGLVVAPAGNVFCPSADCVHYPARFAEPHTVIESTTGTAFSYAGKDFVIAVGCIDAASQQCDWTATTAGAGSSQGVAVTVAAPGDDVLAVYAGCPVGGPTASCAPCPDGSGAVVEHCYVEGTSMSSSLVAGAAALIWAGDPALTPAQVRDYIECTADDLGPAGDDDLYGAGRLDADFAYDAVVAGTCTPTPPPVACTGEILEPDGTPVDPGDSFVGYTVFTTTHSGTHHVSAWNFVTSDGVMPFGGVVTHDDRSVYFGGGASRTVTATVDFGTPVACTATATWTHTN